MTTTRLRKTVARLIGTLAVSLMTLGGLSAAAQADAAQDRIPAPAGGTGCPLGSVCIYPGRGWNGGDPTYAFSSYGVHRIYDQYGTHRIYNNQYGPAYADLCGTSDGNNCDLSISPGSYTDINITEVNSIRLWTY